MTSLSSPWTKHTEACRFIQAPPSYMRDTGKLVAPYWFRPTTFGALYGGDAAVVRRPHGSLTDCYDGREGLDFAPHGRLQISSISFSNNLLDLYLYRHTRRYALSFSPPIWGCLESTTFLKRHHGHEQTPTKRIKALNISRQRTRLSPTPDA